MEKEKSKKKDRIITIAITAVIVLLLAYNVFSYYGAQLTLPGTEIANVSGVDPATDRAKTIDLSQGKILVNFWATWCGACVKEMPYLNEISKKHRVVGIMKGPFSGQNYSAADINFENVLAGEDFFNDFTISVLPTSVLIENGVITEVHVGMITKSVVSDWFGSK